MEIPKDLLENGMRAHPQSQRDFSESIIKLKNDLEKAKNQLLIDFNKVRAAGWTDEDIQYEKVKKLIDDINTEISKLNIILVKFSDFYDNLAKKSLNYINKTLK